MSRNDLLTHYRGIVDSAVEDLIRSYPRPAPVLREAMLYSSMGGKRLRGAILLNVAETLGCRTEDALGFAVAIEMIHAYSLVHDDLPCMDDDDIRRGKPSCHKAYGEAMALLCGDALLTAAFEAASRVSRPVAPLSEWSERPQASSPSADLVLMGIQALARAAGPSGMVAGQVLDLGLEVFAGRAPAGAGVCEEGGFACPEPRGEDVGAPMGRGSQICEMYNLKTGQLFAASAEIGAILGGASTEQIKEARRWGLSFGLAFQIADDLVDQARDRASNLPVTKQKATLLSSVPKESAIYVARRALEDCLSALAVFSLQPVLLEQLPKQASRALSDACPS